MRQLTTNSWYLLACGITFCAATSLVAQPLGKSKFKVVTFAELSKGADEKKGESGAVLLEGLNRLGKAGWEAMAEGERGIVFRESAHSKSWEYRMVRAPESTWNGKSDDDEVLQLVLDGLTTQGWDLCLGRVVDGKHMVFKRAQTTRYDDGKKDAGHKVVDVPLPFRPLEFPPPLPIPSKESSKDGKK